MVNSETAPLSGGCFNINIRIARVTIVTILFNMTTFYLFFSQYQNITSYQPQSIVLSWDDVPWNGEPSWEYFPYHEPMYGNLSCPFEMAKYDIESHQRYSPRPSSEVENNRRCGKLRYRPYKDWIPPSPDVLYDKLKHDATIHLWGDSISAQVAVDLLCYLTHHAQLLHYDITRGPVGNNGCPDDQCLVDWKGPNGLYTMYGYGSASFAVDRGRNETRTIHVSLSDGNFGVWNAKKFVPRFIARLEKAKAGDIIVVNQGLHYQSPTKMRTDIRNVKSAIQSAIQSGVRVLWRETNAAHFPKKHGYFEPDLWGKGSKCVPTTEINATLSQQYFNGVSSPIMEELGLPILEVWESSFLMPYYCHVGSAKGDCAHFLQPGGTSYFTEVLLKYIENEM